METVSKGVNEMSVKYLVLQLCAATSEVLKIHHDAKLGGDTDRETGKFHSSVSVT